MSFKFFALNENYNLRSLGQMLKENKSEETGEQNQEKYSKQINEFVLKGNKLLENEKYVEIIQLLLDIKDEFPIESKLFTNIIGISAYFANEIESAKDQQTVIEYFLKKVKGYKQESMNVNSKLNYMSIMFNALERTNKLQHVIFIEIVNYAAQNDKFSMISANLENLDSLISGWKLNNKDQKKTYETIISQIGSSTQFAKVKTQLIIKYLKSFTESELSQDYLKNINNFIVSLIQIGQLTADFQNILECKAIIFLEKNNQNLYSVFSYFTRGDLDGYMKFEAKNKDCVQKLGINRDDYLQKVRVHTISQFSEVGDSITYQEFAKRLQINIEDVENWIIMAIHSDIIEAQIDQYNQQIYIKAINGKYFDQEDWQKLDTQLSKVIEVLKSYE